MAFQKGNNKPITLVLNETMERFSKFMEDDDDDYGHESQQNKSWINKVLQPNQPVK
jgi:hypothetical protein